MSDNAPHDDAEHAAPPPHGGDLTTAPVPRLIARLAVPASVGFFFNTMFNVVDTYFAGRLSTDALAALSLSFPVFFTLLAMGSGFSTGTTALVGHALGRGDRREAAGFASQGLLMTLLLGALIMTTGYLVTPFLFRLLGARDAYLDMCLQYMRVILAGSPLIMCVYMLNAVLNAQGDTRSFRDYLIVASLANVVLDPWLMFGGLGVPPLGLRGLALATILVQVYGVVFMGRRAWRTGLLQRRAGASWRPRRDVLWAIAVQGVPASGNMMTVALGIFVITYFLSGFGQDAVAAYGVATRIEQIVLLPTIGLNVAALTLAAQNGGAGRYDRVRSAVRWALAIGGAAMIPAGFLLFFGGGRLMGVFADDPAVVAIGAHYLRIAAFLEFAYVILFVNTSALQGLKQPAFALWIGLYRQLAAPILLFWLATRVWGFGLDGIWWGIFGITWSAAAVAVVFALGRVSRLADSAGETSRKAA